MQQYFKVSLKLLWNHVLFIILTLFLIYPFGWLVKTENGLVIYSAIMTLLYFIFIYSEVWEVAKKDNKAYSTTKPYHLKGLVLGLSGSSVTIIIAILFFIAKAGIFNFDIMNLIYRVWMPMFLGFFEKYGRSNDLIFALAVLVLPAASCTGYIAGIYGVSIQEKILLLFKKQTKGKSNSAQTR